MKAKLFNMPLLKAYMITTAVGTIPALALAFVYFGLVGNSRDDATARHGRAGGPTGDAGCLR